MVRSDALISTAELEARLGDPTLAVVEVDEDTTAYEKGHISGAVGLDWVKDLRARPRRDFLDAAALADLLGGHGISAEQTIVLYGGNSNWFAAYAYWLLCYRGVQRLLLLDGGRKKWELESRPLVQDQPRREPTQYRLGPARPDLRVLRDEVLATVGTGSTAFIDVRSPAEFAGEMLAPPHLPQEQAQVPGHIPGAKSIPWSRAVNNDGSFRDIEELQELYSGAGITPDRPTIAYCRIGERSAHTWFVLTQLLHHPHVRNYDGSWTEYGSLVGVPVEC